MGTSIQQLMSLVDARDSAALDDADLKSLQLKAASERLEEQRGAISVLDRRARDLEIGSLTSFDDLVPLLFAHSTYKSYPESFISKGCWDCMNVWLDTVSATHASDVVDTNGIRDVDEWIARLDTAGIHLIVSSGTSGKNSFLAMNDRDVELITTVRGEYGSGHCPVTFLLPSEAPMRISYTARTIAKSVGRPGAISWLMDQLRIVDLMAGAALRKAMIDGTATPSEVAAFERRVTEATRDRDATLKDLLANIIRHRHERQIIYGPWGPFWRLLEIAHTEGIQEASLHPDSVIATTGGLKGLSLPEDYEEQMDKFLGPVRRRRGYGMSELTAGFMMCEVGRYHCPPHLTLLVLDEAGERQLEPDGTGRVRGRVAAYDPGWEGLWGGIVSGDQATISFSPCECGSRGPTLEKDIVRYSELSAAGDDKLTCGGTIESYIRGLVGNG